MYHLLSLFKIILQFCVTGLLSAGIKEYWGYFCYSFKACVASEATAAAADFQIVFNISLYRLFIGSNNGTREWKPLICL